MRLSTTVLVILFATGCVVRDKTPITTQVVTFPDGALVEFNGRPVGRAPAAVVLPQDTNGRLVERTTLRALPNTAQPTLIAQSRVLEPGEKFERVPDQILIDLTLGDSSQTGVSPTVTTHVESGTTNSRPKRVRMPDRGKPTQPVGIDRWNPGIY